MISQALSILSLAALSSATPFLAEFSRFSGSELVARTTCGTSGPQTCHNTTAQSNLCCFESPGGQIVQVQFWDTNPSTGPTNSWSRRSMVFGPISDGTYDSNCDASRNYASITQVLQNNGKSSLVTYMNQYWVDINGDNESFWEHEWSKHGTCMSTIKSTCLPAGSTTGADVAYYFQRAVDTFQNLPTYQYLSAAGITPSTSDTYTYTTLANAIKASTVSLSNLVRFA
ncbi:ribonuclease T2-like [Tulasnella sp. UAMH 9824]|nr:ribonuclease T2-like [Tulasnella sp. UAMH 9824]